MEDPKPAPDPTAQAPPGQPPLPPQSKKRPLDADASSFQNSKYFKMRAVLGDLRPHFIEVLRTPDFRNCKAAEEIRKQVKLLMDLYTQITGNSTPEVQPSTAENRNSQKAPDFKSKEHPEQRSSKPSDNKPFQSGPASEKQRPDDDGKLVGASAFGWNFITFPGNEPVYYGVTKESFRAAQATVQGS
ncbi:uncharacterized protein LOC115678094 [Syzygium oleosum]|uniref:uncharacterized protein LOC115678094 n=1 Tax=Syzygium oleosum TaxID=219896 RepID=UPI0011D1AB10|nr:uncharacterized protein LOC115678094 [Syzygium oleosum]